VQFVNKKPNLQAGISKKYKQTIACDVKAQKFVAKLLLFCSYRLEVYLCRHRLKLIFLALTVCHKRVHIDSKGFEIIVDWRIAIKCDADCSEVERDGL
jgi:hypothetical protein